MPTKSQAGFDGPPTYVPVEMLPVMYVFRSPESAAKVPS